MSVETERGDSQTEALGLTQQRPVRSAGAAPMYMQVANILRNQITTSAGAYTALPSEGDLSQRFGVSRVTIRNALKQLERRGVIYSEQGRGYFTTTARMAGVSGFHSFTSEVQRLGGVATSELIAFRLNALMPETFRKHLQVAGSDEFIALTRLRSIDGRPTAFEEAYLPMMMYPQAERALFEHSSLYEQMGRNWGVVPAWTDALFEPLAATEEVASYLEVEVGAPVLAVWRVTVTDNDQVCEYVRSIYRGDGFMLHVSRYRL